MIDRSRFKFCKEFSVLEKTVEVVVDIASRAQTIRLEAHQQDGDYGVHSFIRRDITVQVTPLHGSHGPEGEMESISVWAEYDLPWISEQSADEAISRSLGFLAERCD